MILLFWRVLAATWKRTMKLPSQHFCCARWDGLICLQLHLAWTDLLLSTTFNWMRRRTQLQFSDTKERQWIYTSCSWYLGLVGTAETSNETMSLAKGRECSCLPIGPSPHIIKSCEKRYQALPCFFNFQGESLHAWGPSYLESNFHTEPLWCYGSVYVHNCHQL